MSFWPWTAPISPRVGHTIKAGRFSARGEGGSLHLDHWVTPTSNSVVDRYGRVNSSTLGIGNFFLKESDSRYFVFCGPHIVSFFPSPFSSPPFF